MHLFNILSYLVLLNIKVLLLQKSILQYHIYSNVLPSNITLFHFNFSQNLY